MLIPRAREGARARDDGEGDGGDGGEEWGGGRVASCVYGAILGWRVWEECHFGTGAAGAMAWWLVAQSIGLPSHACLDTAMDLRLA